MSFRKDHFEPTRIPLEGKTMGRLFVIEPIRRYKNRQQLHYRCKCSCGTEVVVCAQNLRLGKTQSCGCLHRERSSDASLRHGLSHTSIHNTWMSMLQRCEDANCGAYADYGGRGITVCQRWHTFENFLVDMGVPDEGLTLDRTDNDGPYTKRNCQWVTRERQANNRRSSKRIEFRGVTMTQRDWERKMDLRAGQLYDRLHRGWSIERALLTRHN